MDYLSHSEVSKAFKDWIFGNSQRQKPRHHKASTSFCRCAPGDHLPCIFQGRKGPACTVQRHDTTQLLGYTAAVATLAAVTPGDHWTIRLCEAVAMLTGDSGGDLSYMKTYEKWD